MESIGFWLKKLLTFLVYPLPVVFFFLFLGMRWWVLGKHLVRARLAMVFAMFWLAFCSLPFAPSHFLRLLESEYPRLGDRNQILAGYPGSDQSIAYIVVLGGGVYKITNPSYPALTKLPHSALMRVVEAVRLHQYFPKTRLIMSGGDGESQAMTEAAVVLGVNREEILQESFSRDTKEQARLIREMVNGQRFFLVTSAWHMPRSASLFRKQGNQFIPAPTDFISTEITGTWNFVYWVLPSTYYLMESEVVIKEYLGMAVSQLEGAFSHAEAAKL